MAALIKRLHFRSKTILQLSTPIVVAMLSQSLLSLVDAALVAPLGENALAAVGIGSNAMLVAMSFMAGISTAVQTQVARHIGRKEYNQCAVPVNNGILAALYFALPLSVLLVMSSPFIIEVYTSDPMINNEALHYFQIRVMALAAGVFNLSFRGYWNGISKPSEFLKILLTCHIVNGMISYVLTYGWLSLPALGTTGAAVGTFFSMYLCTFLNIRQLRTQAKNHGLFTHWQDKVAFVHLLKKALPDSVQQMLFCIGTMFFYAIIAHIGTTEIAITHVLTTLSLLLILPGVGIGISATTLVSQSLGAGHPEDAWQWGLDAVLLAAIILVTLGLPFILAPSFFLSFFFQESELVAHGSLSLRLSCIGIILDTAALVLPQALLGVGANKTVLYIRFFFQWILLIPLSWLFGPVLGLGLTTILILQIAQRLLSSLVFMRIWQRRQWLNLTL